MRKRKHTPTLHTTTQRKPTIKMIRFLKADKMQKMKMQEKEKQNEIRKKAKDNTANGYTNEVKLKKETKEKGIELEILQ